MGSGSKTGEGIEFGLLVVGESAAADRTAGALGDHCGPTLRLGQAVLLAFRRVGELEFVRVHDAAQASDAQAGDSVRHFTRVHVLQLLTEGVRVPISELVERFVVAGDHGEWPPPARPRLPDAVRILRATVFLGAGQIVPIALLEKKPKVPNRKDLIDRLAGFEFELLQPIDGHPKQVVNVSDDDDVVGWGLGGGRHEAHRIRAVVSWIGQVRSRSTGKPARAKVEKIGVTA